MLESFRRDFELGDWRYDMALDLCLLTGHTLSCPFANILPNIRPDKFVSYGLTRPLDSGMPETMNGVEDAASV